MCPAFVPGVRSTPVRRLEPVCSARIAGINFLTGIFADLKILKWRLERALKDCAPVAAPR
ncbi:MAG: hypothetical protein DBX55_02015 [Verrucomicrobia bacterium]|nr:MAG: hypothetical protein DBX55_02015 [Verrucomicrobiota bacterium]